MHTKGNFLLIIPAACITKGILFKIHATIIFIHDFELAGSCAASQSQAKFKNSC